MWSLLGGTPKPAKLSEKIQKTLFVQFGLSREKVDGLRAAQMPAKLNGRPIRHIKIFDPALLGSESPSIRRYEDLEANPGVILFEGYIEKYGSAHLNETRTSSTNTNQKLPNAVRTALVTRYQVDPREVDGLRWIEKPGTIGDEGVRLVRIFEPRALIIGAPSIRTYADLDSYPEVVHFHGHIDDKNALYLANPSSQDQTPSLDSS